MAKDNGGSAFPNDGTSSFNASTGMTLRDYFAGQALAGSLGNNDVDMYDADYATRSYRLADAMLKVRGDNV